MGGSLVRHQSKVEGTPKNLHEDYGIRVSLCRMKCEKSYPRDGASRDEPQKVLNSRVPEN